MSLMVGPLDGPPLLSTHLGTVAVLPAISIFFSRGCKGQRRGGGRRSKGSGSRQSSGRSSDGRGRGGTSAAERHGS